MKPMNEKTSGMKVAIEKIFPGTMQAIEKERCPVCGEKITGFKDALSKKEYSISGMCQTCQDEVFG